jgi:hypothetical protein
MQKLILCVALAYQAGVVYLFMASFCAMLVGGLNDVVVGAKQDKVLVAQ